MVPNDPARGGIVGIEDESAPPAPIAVIVADQRPALGLVVSDAGWFSELPESVAAKVPVDEFEVATLAAMLELLAGDPELRERMSAAAVEYARREHDLEHVADLYVAAIEEVAGWPAIRDAVLGDVARAAREVAMTPYDRGLAEVAEAAREVGLDH